MKKQILKYFSILVVVVSLPVCEAIGMGFNLFSKEEVSIEQKDYEMAFGTLKEREEDTLRQANIADMDYLIRNLKMARNDKKSFKSNEELAELVRRIDLLEDSRNKLQEEHRSILDKRKKRYDEYRQSISNDSTSIKNDKNNFRQPLNNLSSNEQRDKINAKVIKELEEINKKLEKFDHERDIMREESVKIARFGTMKDLEAQLAKQSKLNLQASKLFQSQEEVRREGQKALDAIDR